MPVFLINSIPDSVLHSPRSLTATDATGLGLWVGGFACETFADRQKARWLKEKREKKHDEDFLTRGLWSHSRHPNYFGETVLWTGLAVAAAGAMCRYIDLHGPRPMAVWEKLFASIICGISPAFVTFLLTCVSGVPLSESKYDRRYGNRLDYQAWKQNTPVYIPKIWK
jgi:steroid 5-alpha reductase family enzyme